VLVANALWRQRFADRALGWSLRLGMTMTIVGAMMGGCDHCGEIAAAIGIEVKEVYNAMKRLDRRVAAVSRRMVEVESSL